MRGFFKEHSFLTKPRGACDLNFTKVGELHAIVVFVGRKWSDIGNLINLTLIHKSSLTLVIMFI